ncbi:glycosyltransferase [Ancylobacter sp. 6x-1]|uniref:Glycosyltransferase n=1 Tax=Ancylobacter crimeensis TaxID=2579147 RepID=A0ABT0DEK6_9HYPH|nr:glycosyltransferase [Ancylobacter crimeensis]MCK0198405.1 glycosyltransferase [Ancylobacter crimeensis]
MSILPTDPGSSDSQPHASNAAERDSSLDIFASPALEPIFYPPALLGKPSAWWSHVPFAFWAMTACRPRLFVELGSHYGVSYAAFCEANLLGNLGAQCIAVDTWKGDEHAGTYGDEIYDELRSFNEQKYSAFSTLIRSTFVDALGWVRDGSVDLLHIDGRHRYEDVVEDFQSWLPKLSDRAVVLFHDTNARERDFGVHRAFAELKERYATFEFLHGHGLGIAIVGKNAPAAMTALCSLTDTTKIAAIRNRFNRVGSLWYQTTREQIGAEAHGRAMAEQDESWRQRLNAAAHEAAEHLRLAEAELGSVRNMRDRTASRLAALRSEVEALNEELAVALERNAEAAALLARQETTRAVRNRPAEKKQGRRKSPAALDRLLQVLRPRRRRRVPGEETLSASALFDRDWYLATYPDVGAIGMEPVVHYALYGAQEGRDPGPRFSTSDYLARNPDVGALGINPLVHYELHGQVENRAGGMRGGADTAAVGESTRNILPRLKRRQSLLWVSSETNTPGHLYRVMRYVKAAQDNDAHADWVDVRDVDTALGKARRCDAVIFWRVPWSAEAERIVAAAREAGATVLFDVDDLMIDPQFAKTEIIDGIRSQHLTDAGVQGFYAQMRRMMMEADLCCTTTEELAFHMRWAGKPTFILPNGFDDATHDLSLLAARKWRDERDGLIRIGYAGGSRTHQKDFGLAVPGIAAALRNNPDCRLVLFRTADGKTPLVDVEEFPELVPLAGQIEWRPMRKLPDLPWEMARFDINLAPLEFGNVFCEAKSELKFFEAALVDVPTVASPTGPFRRAIVHGETGFLAASPEDWTRYLQCLVESPELRRTMAHRAYHATLSTFGPRRRMLQLGTVLDQLDTRSRAARGFALAAARARTPAPLPTIYPSEVAFEHDSGGLAEVTVIIPSHNYEHYVVEALDSVAAQTLETLDLVVVDDASPDRSLEVTVAWARRNAARFNRIVVLKNERNYGLGPSRNVGFDAARSPYVLPLDADNRLQPECCELLLAAIRNTTKAFVYPTIQHFDASSALISNVPYCAQHLAAGNYIDAMALISKEAWAMVGGYDHVRFGWEDYDLWCRFAELGLAGEWVPEVLADYRVHAASMLRQQTTVTQNYMTLMRDFERRHPWVGLVDRPASLMPITASAVAKPEPSRLDRLISILRCPVTGQKLMMSDDGTHLISLDRTQQWPIVEGRPALAPELAEPEVRPYDLISNEVPQPALDIINETVGWVLNLSAGGSAVKHDRVVEVEYAIFRHTDVLADAHHLPFDDESFDAVISMNAFEHYRDPPKVAAELMRVLKPGGRIHVRTAFLQPLHEKPWHFYNCTRYGMKAWFEAFNEEKLDVSLNFCPNHTVSWIASECEQAMRQDLSASEVDAFIDARMGEFVELWRDPAKRASPLWQNFEKLLQDRQEVTAAGFEFIGRKPTRAEAGHRNMRR